MHNYSKTGPVLVGWAILVVMELCCYGMLNKVVLCSQKNMLDIIMQETKAIVCFVLGI